MPVITCIDDLKQLYRRRVPKMFYDYCETGSWTEQTFNENVSDFDKVRLRQRVAVDMTGRTTSSQDLRARPALTRVCWIRGFRSLVSATVFIN